jgi:hypothetical protein
VAFLSLEKPSTYILNIDTLLLRAITTSPWRPLVHLVIEHACDVPGSIHISVPEEELGIF